MGQATTLLIRERIVDLHHQGESLISISEQLSIPYGTVKQIYRRFRERGRAGLIPDYANCGPRSPYYGKSQQDQVLEYRALHPRWGAPRLRVELQKLFEQSDAPIKLASVRTIQRWLRKSEAYSPRRQGSEPIIGRAKAPHNIWEVDAKENLILGDGTAACYLTIADEKSGAWLEAPVFPLQTHQSGTD